MEGNAIADIGADFHNWTLYDDWLSKPIPAVVCPSETSAEGGVFTNS